jgi:acyl-CoA thioester hydrolase
MTQPKAPAIHREEFVVPESAIDQNGHVNNVAFVQWMQDVATRHFDSGGVTEAVEAAGGTWVARSHKIEYLSPAFAGEHIQALTWILDFSRVRSLRRYKFLRASDGKLLVRGETDWVFVNAKSGRPCSIPDEIKRAFVTVSQEI